MLIRSHIRFLCLFIICLAITIFVIVIWLLRKILAVPKSYVPVKKIAHKYVGEIKKYCVTHVDIHVNMRILD